MYQVSVPTEHFAPEKIYKNVDYTIENSFYIKNIDKYVLDGEILSLNRAINRFHGGDINKLKKIASRLLEEVDVHEKESN